MAWGNARIDERCTAKPSVRQVAGAQAPGSRLAAPTHQAVLSQSWLGLFPDSPYANRMGVGRDRWYGN